MIYVSVINTTITISSNLLETVTYKTYELTFSYEMN